MQFVNSGCIASRSFGALVKGTTILAAGLLCLQPLAVGQESEIAEQVETDAQPVNRLGTIMVTAQRREQNLQDVPVAVTAFSADAIEQLGFNQINDVANQTPNFSVTGLQGDAGTGSTNAWLEIRGLKFVDLSNVNDGPVALYIDQVFQQAQGAGLSQMFDVERVEVLKGPQGTLFGRNTTGGLVQVVTRKPGDTFEGYIEGEYGEFNKRVLEGVINVPLEEGLSVRFAARHSANDGMQENPLRGFDDFGKNESLSARMSIAADFGEDVSVLLSVNSTTSQGFAGSPIFQGIWNEDATALCNVADVLANRCYTVGGERIPTQKFEDAYQAFPLPSSLDKFGAMLEINWDLGWAELVSVTGHEEFQAQAMLSYMIDPSLTTSTFVDRTVDYRPESSNFSQEVRLQGETDRIDWVAGVYYYEDTRSTRTWDSRQSIDVDGNPVLISQGRSSSFGQVSTESKAIFGHLDYALTDQFELSGGLRYTDEDRTLDAMAPNGSPALPAPESVNFSAMTGDISLNFKPTDDILTYLKYARGFKSGGYGANAGNIAQRGPAEEETIDAYEIGFKSELMNDRVRLNAAAYYYDYKGLQANAGTIRNGAPVVDFINAGDATLMGGEIEIQATPIDPLFLSLGLGFQESEIDGATNPDGTPVTIDGGLVDGNEMPAPNFNANAVIRYDFEPTSFGKVSIQADGRYQGDTFHSVDASPFEHQEAYGLLNLRLFWTSADGQYTAEAFIQNVTDELYATTYFYTPSRYIDTRYYSAGLPRTWGVKLGYEF